MFVSDNVAQSSFCLLLLYLSPFKYNSYLHFILSSPDDFILGPLHFNALGITCSTHPWVGLHGRTAVNGNEKRASGREARSCWL